MSMFKKIIYNNPKGDMLVVCTCPLCDSENKVRIPAEAKEHFVAWSQRNEGNIQDMLPELTPQDRELLITGICENCWNLM